MTRETAKLVLLAQNGDLDAFGKLAKHFYPALVSIAYATTANHHTAEDAAQETLARALKAIKTLKTAQKCGSWLRSICKNVAKDMLGRKTRQNQAEKFASPSREPESDDKRAMVVEAVRDLPETDREIVTLRYYQNLSYEQISEVLGISAGAINGRVKRAKQKIATHLKQRGYNEF